MFLCVPTMSSKRLNKCSIKTQLFEIFPSKIVKIYSNRLVAKCSNFYPIPDVFFQRVGSCNLELPFGCNTEGIIATDAWSPAKKTNLCKLKISQLVLIHFCVKCCAQLMNESDKTFSAHIIRREDSQPQN